jgi:hypothetical protein
MRAKELLPEDFLFESTILLLLFFGNMAEIFIDFSSIFCVEFSDTKKLYFLSSCMKEVFSF